MGQKSLLFNESFSLTSLHGLWLLTVNWGILSKLWIPSSVVTWEPVYTGALKVGYSPAGFGTWLMRTVLVFPLRLGKTWIVKNSTNFPLFLSEDTWRQSTILKFKNIKSRALLASGRESSLKFQVDDNMRWVISTRRRTRASFTRSVHGFTGIPVFRWILTR